ncbi:MAG: transcription termination/antitermination protein NusA [Thermoguttaceae bacterium]
MNPQEIQKLVEQIYREKGLEKETVLRCIEEGLVTAAKRHGSGSVDSTYLINIDRRTCEIYAYRDNVPIPVENLMERAGAQSARQSIAQKIREAVCNKIYNKYIDRKGELVVGIVKRGERGGVSVIIDGDQEAWLPNSEKLNGEIYRNDSQLDFVINNVEMAGTRTRIILSRRSKTLLQRLFERECPEIREGRIQIKAIARDPGSRSKVAVWTEDNSIDLFGACLGPRNSRCSSVSKALNNERIDIVQWNEKTDLFIMNALAPADVSEVILCPRLDRAIVVVRPDQRALAIGRRGQNVNLAKVLSGGWDIDILTRDDEHDELADLLDRATEEFSKIDGLTAEWIEELVGNGFTCYYDLACIEPDDFVEITGAPRELAISVAGQADELSLQEEKNRDNLR